MDFNICAGILVAAYNGESQNNTWTKEEALLRIEATMSGFNARRYVVEKDGQIIAMGLGRIGYYYNNWSKFCVDEFNVNPSHQGQGVGKKLMNFIFSEIKNEEINGVFLITGGEQTAKFYKDNGFKKSSDGIMMEINLEDKQFGLKWKTSLFLLEKSKSDQMRHSLLKL